jgi:DNA polymerase I
MKKLIIIDISNYIFRAFFAIRPLHAPDGTPVNAVYGVLSMIHNLMVKYRPTHLFIARDTKDGSFRAELFPQYKAHRSEPPDELIPQFALVDELIKVLGIPEMRLSRYEADDIIGSAAVQWKKYFDEILIASGDKDLMQFVEGPVKMLDTMKEVTYSREDVKDKMGVYPEQIVDYLSLIGDSSDNIPGVPGIGPKGAQNLLEEFGSLENILAHIPEIKNKRCQTALLEHKDKAIVSQELAKIVTDLKLDHSPDQTSYKLQVDAEMESFLERLGFRSWLTKLADFKVKPAHEQEQKKEQSHQKQLSVETWSIDDLRQNLSKTSAVAIEAIGDDELDQFDLWRGIIVATDLKTGHLNLDKDSAPSFIEALQQAGVMVICFQAKPLLQQAMICGINPCFNYFDLSQAHFVINPEMRHDLATMAQEYLGLRLPIPAQQADLFGLISATDLQHQGERAQSMLSLMPLLRQKMQELEVEGPYDQLDIPLIKVLAAMELEGVRLDIEFYKNLEKEFSAQIEEIESQVQSIAGDKVNLRSPKQVGELLFDKLQLPVIRKTKTGYSTDVEVLTELMVQNASPVPELLLKYREIEKLLSTYVKALPVMIHPLDKKIHTHYRPSNAATGRLSSDHPNLQNIPVRTENGRKLRKGFIPTSGRILLSADYSQVELRLLAHFSQDPNMLDAFKRDLDIHRQTAAEVFEVPLDKVTKEMRNGAKAINFGLMYGQTSFGLSQSLRISQGEAKKYITSYFKKFHRVKSYLDELKEQAESSGHAITLFGRKRSLPDIRSTNRQVKAMAERMAINSPIQGTAADIIKLAMIHIHQIIQDSNLKSRMILQVHDELIFDVVPDELEVMKNLVVQEMEGAVKLSVPLKVDVGMGQNWYDLK